MTEEQIKELLELLKKALESETVERITISIKPNKKNKQSYQIRRRVSPPVAFIITDKTRKCQGRFGAWILALK